MFTNQLASQSEAPSSESSNSSTLLRVNKLPLGPGGNSERPMSSSSFTKFNDTISFKNPLPFITKKKQRKN